MTNQATRQSERGTTPAAPSCRPQPSHHTEGEFDVFKNPIELRPTFDSVSKVTGGERTKIAILRTHYGQNGTRWHIPIK